MVKKDELIQFLGEEDEDAVKQSDYDENVFVTADGAEYLVLDEDEAERAFKEAEENLIDDIGIEGFTENFKQYIKDNAVDKLFLESAAREEIENRVYEYDIPELIEDLEANELVDEYFDEDEIVEHEDEYKDKLIDKLYEDSDIDVDYFIDIFGEHETWKWLLDYNAIDINDIISEAESWDGRGPTLASYDGVENATQNYYIYRIN